MVRVTLWYVLADGSFESKQYRCTEVDVMKNELHLNFSNGRLVVKLHAIDSFTVYASVLPGDDANVLLDGMPAPASTEDEPEDLDWLLEFAEDEPTEIN